jgi:lysophospholipase L1-like esterase
MPSTYAAQFASGHYLACADAVPLRFGPADWTITGWFKLDSTAANFQFIFGKEANGQLEAGLFYGISGFTKTLQAEAWHSGGPGFTTLDSLLTFSTGDWHWFAFWHDGGTNSIYFQVDSGTPISAVLPGVLNTSTSDLRLGSRVYDGSPLTGGEAAFGRWSRVLSSDERTYLYNAGSGRYFVDLSSSVKTGLVAWWDLQEASGSRADSSGNGLTLSDNGGVTQTAGIAGAGGITDPPVSEDPVSVDIALTSATASGVTLTAAATNAISYQWHRSSTPDFTPSGATAISGATNTTLADTIGTANVPRYYRCVATGGSLSAISLWAAGTKLGTVPLAPPSTIYSTSAKILFVGDSITSGYGLPNAIRDTLQTRYPSLTVTTVNAGVGGSRSTDWISGSSNLISAKNAAVSACGSPSQLNRVYVLVMLGVNDSRVSPPGNTQSQYVTNMRSLLGDLVAAGYTPILNDFPMVRAEPSPNPYDTDAGAANHVLYRQSLDSLANNTSVYRGDTYAFSLFGNHLEYFVRDGSVGGYTWVHPNTAGVTAFANLQATAFANVASVVNTFPMPTNVAATTYPSVSASGATLGSISQIDQSQYRYVTAQTLSSPVTVTLTSPYSNSEIRYTLNGKNPNPSSHLYTAPLVFTKNGSGSEHTAIKARIYDKANANNKSKIIRLDFRVR